MLQMHPRRQKTALILIFFCLAAGIALIGFFTYKDYEKQYRSGMERNLTAIAELKIYDLLHWRSERIGDGAVFYQNKAFSYTLETFRKDPLREDVRWRLLEWLEHVKSANNYDRIFLLDSRGNPVLPLPGEYEIVDPVILEDVRQHWGARGVRMLDIYQNPVDGEPYLAVIVPITDSQTQTNTIATLVLRIDPKQYLYPYINAWPSSSSSAETLIVRKENQSGVFLNPLRFRADSPLMLRFSLYDEDLPAAIAARGYRGITEGRDYRDVPVIAFVSQIPESPWYIIARVDQDEVITPIRQRMLETSAIVIALIIIAALILGYLWRQREARLFREKFEAAETLRISQEKFAKVIRSNLVSMVILDGSGRFVEFNEAFCTFCGYTPQELQGKTALEIGLVDDPERVRAVERVLERDASARNLLLDVRTKRGDVRFGQASIETIAIQGASHWMMVITDITSLKEAELRVKKLNRVFAVLSDINQSIVRIKDEAVLFEKVCTIAAERGAFQLAWIATAEPPLHHLSLMACDGTLIEAPKRFMLDWETLRSDWEDFIPTLLKDGSFISNDLLDEKKKIPWRYEALREGLNSMAVYPLITAGTLRGVFALYTAEPRFFDREEQQLLEEMAMDVSFSLEVQDQERDRQRMLRTLEESEVRYRTVADHTYDWEYWLMPDGHLEYISPSCKWITGRSAVEFIHHPALINEIVYPPDQNLFEDHVRMAQTHTSGEAIHEVDFRIIHTDGNLRWIGHTCKHIFREDGSDLGIRATNRDITDRKNIEQALEDLNAELEERIDERTAELSDLYHNAPCGYHSLDRNGIIVRINDTELAWFGYTREEMIGRKKFMDIVTQESVETFQRNFPKFMKQGWIKDLEFDVIRKDGSIMPVLVSATAIYNANGEYAMSRSTLIDNSERKKAYQNIQELADSLAERIIEVEASNRELEDFAYTVSHDLRAPLRAIDGYTRIIVEEKHARLDEEGKALFANVTRNVEKMNRMIEDLLTYARINRIDLEAGELDMETLVKTEFRKAVAAETQDHTTIVVSVLPRAYGDRSMIQRVLGSLIENAVKFSQETEKPTLEAGGYETENECVFYIKDNGIGFDQAYADRLFRIFQRYHRSDQYEGNGIGLAIVQRMVERHGGRVWAEGVENGGATFYFSLPKKAASG